MGLLDWFRRRADPLRDAALRIDLDAGVLERCPVCGDIVDKQRDERLAEADRHAARLIDSDAELVRPFHGDLARLQRLLRSVREPYPFSCRCEAYD